MQDFADLPHGGDEEPPAHAEADPAPALHRLLLGRQAGGQASAALIDVDEELEGGLNVRHAGPGLSGVRVSDALRRAQPASTALMVFSRVSSSTGLVR